MPMPCACSGCNSGYHSNGKACRYCGGHGSVLDGSWPRPCWNGYGSDDLPPRRRTTSSRSSTLTAPPRAKTAAELEAERLLAEEAARKRKEEEQRAAAERAAREAAEQARIAAELGAQRKRDEEAARRTAGELSELLDGRWAVTARSGGTLDMQDFQLARHRLRRSEYHMVSRSGAMKADGSWRALNGRQIEIDGFMQTFPWGFGPFHSTITFEVMSRRWLRGNAEAVAMDWRRE